MIVVTITLTDLTQAGKRKKAFWEIDAGSMKALVDRLNAGDIVCGCVLQVRKDKGDKGNAMEVFGASELALTKAEIARIETPNCSLVRYEDEATA